MNISSLGLPDIAIPGTYSVFIAQGQPGGLPIPDASTVGKYARTTDLYGEKTDLVLGAAYVRAGITKYFWQPVRTDWKISLPVSSMTLSALKTPNKLRFTGSLAITQNLILDDVNAYPGLTYDIAGDFTGLGSIAFSGTLLGSITTLLVGGRRRVSFDGSAWSQES